MLIMRARPPPAQDFIAVFQKFKLAINILVSGFSPSRPMFTSCQIVLIGRLIYDLIFHHVISQSM